MGSQLFKNADDTDALAASIGGLMEFLETLKKNGLSQ
jgi:2-dehydro-3-deoxyphosphogluconate aldolase/(4S)-4-hydroxy-2-oxoglutarate aldolase